MLAVLSDTHATTEPELSAHLNETLTAADQVVHAGDFTAEVSLDAFAAYGPLTAVVGNRDDAAVRDRLPETATVEWDGLGLVVVHGHRRDATSLSMLARQEDADVVVRGHSHRQRLDDLGETLLCNPGSHADPRGNRAGYAAVERADGGHVVELRSPEGEAYESRRL